MEKIKNDPELAPGVSIKICEINDIEALNKAMPSEGFHEARFKLQQEGKSSYLVAWQNGTPVGHLDIKWSGSSQPVVKEFIDKTPELSAISVWPPEKRSQGIGSMLIAEAEEMVKGRGYDRVGLSVREDNHRARELYEKLGYQDWGQGTYNDIWQTVSGKQSDKICSYMVKNL